MMARLAGKGRGGEGTWCTNPSAAETAGDGAASPRRDFTRTELL